MLNLPVDRVQISEICIFLLKPTSKLMDCNHLRSNFNVRIDLCLQVLPKQFNNILKLKISSLETQTKIKVLVVGTTKQAQLVVSLIYWHKDNKFLLKITMEIRLLNQDLIHHLESQLNA